jgi:hypothetical protein
VRQVPYITFGQLPPTEVEQLKKDVRMWRWIGIGSVLGAAFGGYLMATFRVDDKLLETVGPGIAALLGGFMAKGLVDPPKRRRV